MGLSPNQSKYYELVKNVDSGVKFSAFKNVQQFWILLQGVVKAMVFQSWVRQQ